jgi:hypothetical protein
MNFTAYTRFRRKGEPRTYVEPPAKKPKIPRRWRRSIKGLDYASHALAWDGKGSLVGSQLLSKK